MEVIYGLFNNMKVVMSGTEVLLDITFGVLNVSSQTESHQSIIFERLLVRELASVNESS